MLRTENASEGDALADFDNSYLGQFRLPGPGAEDANGVPAPSSRGMLGKARAFANRAFVESIPVEADGHGNGHGLEGAGEEHAAVGSAGAPAQLPSGDSSDEDSGSS